MSAQMYQQPFIRFVQQLGLLKGLLAVTHAALERAKRYMSQVVAENEGPPAFIHASRTFFFDLTAEQDDRWKMEFVTPGFGAVDQEVVAAIDAKQARERASSVSQMFEAFETYVKDVTAAYLHLHPDQASASKVRDFDKQRAHAGLPRTDPFYWSKFVREKMGGADAILKVLRQRVHCIDRAERNNIKGFDLKDWFVAMYEVRHATTHADYEIKTERYDPLSQQQKELLLTNFQWQLLDGRRVVGPTQQNVDHATEMFADYGLALFKCLVSLEGWDWKAEAKEVLPLE